jgi:hypothetical protein
LPYIITHVSKYTHTGADHYSKPAVEGMLSLCWTVQHCIHVHMEGMLSLCWTVQHCIHVHSIHFVSVFRMPLYRYAQLHFMVPLASKMVYKQTLHVHGILSWRVKLRYQNIPQGLYSLKVDHSIFVQTNTTISHFNLSALHGSELIKNTQPSALTHYISHVYKLFGRSYLTPGFNFMHSFFP